MSRPENKSGLPSSSDLSAALRLAFADLCISRWVLAPPLQGRVGVGVVCSAHRRQRPFSPTFPTPTPPLKGRGFVSERFARVMESMNARRALGDCGVHGFRIRSGMTLAARQPANPGQCPKEKAPALSGRGSAVSAGRGEGADHRGGGYMQNVLPALGFPKKLSLEKRAKKTKRPGIRTEALRRQLPFPATISRPRFFHNLFKRSGKVPARGRGSVPGLRRPRSIRGARPRPWIRAIRAA
jgi:hypothetical protein